jgi:hypothetical protein
VGGVERRGAPVESDRLGGVPRPVLEEGEVVVRPGVAGVGEEGAAEEAPGFRPVPPLRAEEGEVRERVGEVRAGRATVVGLRCRGVSTWRRARRVVWGRARSVEVAPGGNAVRLVAPPLRRLAEAFQARANSGSLDERGEFRLGRGGAVEREQARARS